MISKFICPRGCDPKYFNLQTVQGWKKHMSGMHGSYSDEELKAIAGAGVDTQPVRERMRDFAATMSGPSTELGATATSVASEGETVEAPAPKRVRTVKAGTKKAKRILTKIPEKFLTAQGIELDDDDRDGLTEAVEFLEDIFGLQFEVPEGHLTIRSRFLAILWPILIIGLIFVKHKFGWKFGEEEPSKIESQE